MRPAASGILASNHHPLAARGAGLREIRDEQEEWQTANGKEQMANGFPGHLKFAVCHLKFSLF